jgi:mannose-6-phosphate isomerase-like protein (cupin superfamily)
MVEEKNVQSVPLPDRLTVGHAMSRLREVAPQPFVELFAHGTLQIELYAPDRVDNQEPHDQDEVYVVISGFGEFVNGDTRRPFEAGEVLFVPAGVEHRFEHFTEDFATWVIFYGPVGGEKADV